ncbi:MAG: hypothetical protein WD081_00120 [Gammaproteobacteria bacterium]
MVEPDVALTDFAIAIACALFAVFLARARRQPLRDGFVWLFAATGAAALVGGIAHGFFDLGADTDAVRALWLATMALTGGAGAALWLVTAALVAPSQMQKLVRRLVVVEWLAYLAWIIWIDPSFRVAIIQYTLPAFALLATFVWRYSRNRHPTFLIGVAALVLTFVAGALQQAAFTPVDALTHNAFFHILQLIALSGLFMTARRIDEAIHG